MHNTESERNTPAPTRRALLHTSESDFRGNERLYVDDCLARGRVTQGKYVNIFESQIYQLACSRHAIACSSGTSALHLIMLALNVGPRDAVIVPAFTYIATANAAAYTGARVAFVDVDPVTWCIDTDAVALAVADHYRRGYHRVFVVPVHMYDALAAVDRLGQFNLIIDAAHAPGAVTPYGLRVGEEGIATAFSFYASKVIACGEGGAVVTDDTDIAARIRLFRGQGATIPGRYHHSVIGCNYRMTDLHAAIGTAQMERLPAALERRRELVTYYRERLRELGTPVQLQGGNPASGWAFGVVLPADVDRIDVASALTAAGIETRPFFDPLHLLPPYRGTSAIPRSFPVAERIGAQGLVLPLHTLMSTADVDYVCETLHTVLGGAQ